MDQIPEDGNVNPAPQEDGNANPVPQEDDNANPAPQEDDNANPAPQEDGNANPAPQRNQPPLDPAVALLGFQVVQQEEFNLANLAPVQYRDLNLDDEDIVDGQNFNLQAETNHVLKAPRLIPGVREIVKLKGSIIEPNRYLCVAGDGVTEYNLIIPEGFMLRNLLQDGVFVVINIHQDANGEKDFVLHRLIENNLVVRHYMYRGEWPQNAVFHVNF